MAVPRLHKLKYSTHKSCHRSGSAQLETCIYVRSPEEQGAEGNGSSGMAKRTCLIGKGVTGVQA